MVKTGARVSALRAIMAQLGHVEAIVKPAAPRLATLPSETADSVMDLYRLLGGAQKDPILAPGSWDIAYTSGLVVELDEEMHFNRYRSITLEAPWAGDLPWTDPYRLHTVRGEGKSGTGGKRWTNPSAEGMFGRADPGGIFGDHGAPRWKQRALYDAMKDAAAASGQVRLARVSVYDLVDGQLLNQMLYGRASVDPMAVDQLIESRTV